MKALLYPIYFKLDNTNTWYKVTSDFSFTEVKMLGSYYSISDYSDDILPMRNHISDLLMNQNKIDVSALDFSSHMENLQKTKELRDF